MTSNLTEQDLSGQIELRSNLCPHGFGQERSMSQEKHRNYMSLRRKIFVLAIWALVSWPIRYFLGALWAPDLCLDQGGSFDYRLWQCSQESQPYINTPLYRIPGFWLAVISILLAIGGTALIHRSVAPQAHLPKDEE